MGYSKSIRTECGRNMARRSEHSQEEIKQMILEAAEDIVQEYGFSALKVRKIAADIGYTVGSIYMVFTGMDDLIIHIKARTWQKLAKHIEGYEAAVESPGSIESFALGYLDFVVANEGLWRMLFEHHLPVGKENPGDYLQAQITVFLLAERRLKRLDSQCSDEQVHQAARVLVNSMQGVSMQLLMQQISDESITATKLEMLLLVGCFMKGWQGGG
jgi:AcrR family transcriptional regulator